ncbi:MAG: hypothetical protein Q7J04_10225 [Microcella sp.]|nr:hypothetical protein [Microcella sp.]
MSLLGALLLATAFFSVGGVSAPAAAAPLSQCNGISDDGDGVECDVTITNEWDMATGTGSSTVVTRVCVGAANVDFGPGDCTVTSVEYLDDVTTTVGQCNGTVNGGGATLRCTVTITNTIVGTGTSSIASVNQCNGSFDSLDPLPAPSFCDPVQATTDATIAQCNDSINGGTNVSMQCTVGVSTVSSALPISVDQCNGSANGGGALVECSTVITTLFVPVDDENGDDDGSGGDGVGGDGNGAELAATGSSSTLFIGVGGAAVLLLGATLALTARKSSLG